MKRLKLFLVRLAIIIIMSMLTSCGSSSDNISCGGNSISYQTEVSPIITSYCATSSGCHASGSHEGPGALSTYAQVYASRAAISSVVSNGSMPRGATLTSNQKSTIVCWIKNGASNN